MRSPLLLNPIRSLIRPDTGTGTVAQRQCLLLCSGFGQSPIKFAAPRAARMELKTMKFGKLAAPLQPLENVAFDFLLSFTRYM